ncbi:MAG: hypothetical protein LBD13_07285 [Spirochaetaceae bacterium]|jgi:hypothetical protein|nr:hypothetical protein [Spirochaetaceae bacterium]
MNNKALLDELYKIGKLPSDNDDVDDFPFDDFHNYLKQIKPPLDYETVIRLINLSPPVDTGAFGVESTLVHLIEKYENYFDDFQKLMDNTEEGEVKNMLRERMKNYLEHNK